MHEVPPHRAFNAPQRIQSRREAIRKRTGSQPDAVELIRLLRKGDTRREF
jgi:hypothetical protein